MGITHPTLRNARDRRDIHVREVFAVLRFRRISAMDNAYQLHLFDLLEQAQEWPADEREQRARELCADGPVPVADLLAALERSSRLPEFLEDPAWGADSPLGPPTEGGESWLGRHIGRYRLEEVLGSGGMGQVFLAEQDEPRRQVALKLIRSEMASEAAGERFRAEQQALARLNHPYIAQFLDAGVSEDGRPFFAMELVEGRSLDRYVQENAPSLEQRLRLFLDICAAVHHAHQKQIVHRDLKPSNVLVREIDGRPTVKVIDFGIAQALDRPTNEVEVTESGGVYGTPEYLSPESFDGDVDTRADVYGLGVLLYQLVTGARPFRRGDSSAEELVQRIRRGDKTPASRRARTENIPWANRLRGDLDAVIDRAMDPDRKSRYGSVVDLVADVERFLELRPVSVREAGRRHHLSLLFRRRKGTVIAATAVCLSVLAGATAGTFGLLRAREEAESARRALQESEAMTGFLTGLFEQSDPDQATGTELSARDLLDQGVERLDSELQEHPRIRARLTRTIGDIYAKLGHYDQAEGLLEESLALFEQQFGDTHRERARALSGLGVMKAAAGEPDAARAFFERTLTVLEDDPTLDPTLTALTVYHLGVLDYREEDYVAASGRFDRACALWQQTGGEEEYQARCFDALGVIRQEQDRPAEAREYFTRSLRLREASLGPDHLHVAVSYESLCVLELDLMLLADGEASCGRSLRIRQQALGELHARTIRTSALLSGLHRLRGDFKQSESVLIRALSIDMEAGRFKTAALSWIRLGWVSWLQGRYEEAEDRYRQAAALLPESFEESTRAATAQQGIGLSLWKQGDLDEAERVLQRVYEFRMNHNGADNQQTAWPIWGLAGVHGDRGTPESLARAADLYDRALSIRRAYYPETHDYRAVMEADYRDFLAQRRTKEAP